MVPMGKEKGMNNNDFYYTISTISQTLAGAFGFLVAIVLYRMQSIKESLPLLKEKADDARHEAIRASSAPAAAHAMAENEKSATLAAFKEEEQKLMAVRKELSHSLKWTAGIIIACFAAMPFVNVLTRGAFYYPSCLGLLCLVCLAAYCVITYLPLVRTVSE
jgi:hypothetical protein